MRAHEFITDEKLDEIEYMSQNLFPQEDVEEWLNHITMPRNLHYIPSNSRYKYGITVKSNGDVDIVIVHNNEIVAAANLDKYVIPSLSNTYEVSSIGVTYHHQKRNLAKTLYQIALYPEYGLNLTIVSGNSQTPGGIRNWVSLIKMPNISVTGYIQINPDHPYYQKYVDTVLNDLDGKYLGDFEGSQVYEFPVKYHTNLNRVDNAVADKISTISVYDGHTTTGMIARYIS
jgi:hypothetical protein